ncbi:MAG: YARHG domain-containing protein [Chitinophagaceae bacterium]|nr:YARHG domain-containing protein [Chitinophagaceae bacterium]
MNKFLMLLLSGSLLIACNNEKKTDKKTDQPEDTTTASVTDNKVNDVVAVITDPFEKFLGSFVGPFGDNKITLLISRIWSDSVQGRSIVGGNDRPFIGTHTSGNDGVFHIDAREPGDHKDDGAFSISIQSGKPDEVFGKWVPNDKKRPAKEFTLSKKKFEYRTDVGSWPESSQRLLKATDLENLMKEDLEFMRNEIFARHGYCFNKKHLRQQFEMEDWYVPNTVDIKGFLTDIEKKNIEMIKRYEKYAEEYGDEYGR